MEAKIKLFDADGTQIGETFARRARQLVKQQRAIWMDDDHSAIRFNPDSTEDDWNEEIEHGKIPRTIEKHPELDPLYVFAKKRLTERRRVILHLVLLVPEMIAVIFFTVIIGNGWHSEPAFLFFGFVSGVLITANACNVYYYYDKYVKGRPYGVGTSSYWENRREMQLAAEVEKLRRMGYGE